MRGIDNDFFAHPAKKLADSIGAVQALTQQREKQQMQRTAMNDFAQSAMTGDVTPESMFRLLSTINDNPREFIAALPDAQKVMLQQEVGKASKDLYKLVMDNDGDLDRETMFNFMAQGKYSPAALGLATKGVMEVMKGFGSEVMEPPKTREIKRGNNIITQEWNAKTGTYVDIAEAPAWEPAKPTGDVANLEYVQGRKPTMDELTRYRSSGASQQNVNVDTGKTMPAGEVSQTGEYGVYKETILKILDMVDQGKTDTGPFEFIKKRMDNWGVLPDKDRIATRALVARLPGLLYAMRGKQLSDKELEVALDMMPQMRMADEAFAGQLSTFADYMSSILKGKEKAFKGAGYNTGAYEGLIEDGPETSDMTDEELLNSLGL